MHPQSWSGRAVEQARTVVGAWLPAPCGHCSKIVSPGESWVVGHKIARSLRPDLMFEVSNWRPEHRLCSDKSAQSAVIAKAKAEAYREAGFSPPTADGQPPLFPVSPSWGPRGPVGGGLGPGAKPVEPRAELTWSPAVLRSIPWLAEFADVPDDAAPPLAMSLPSDDAVGSYGLPDPEREVCPEGACAWIERTQGLRLRWWQRLAIVRQLEHRSDGTLCYRTVVESAPRRAGKSLRVRGVALWRLSHAKLLGEIQTVVHTGSDVAICREIQRGSWRWCEATWGRGSVSKANGKEAVEAPDGSRWLVRAQDAVYGYDVHLGVVDEAWNVKPDTVTEGLEPATLERRNPQLHITSTSHRRATSLMRTFLTSALTVDDSLVLVMLWAAPWGSDPGDPDAWRAASPHWSEDRRKFVAAKYDKALASEDDPEFDDPNPIAGFTAQYLNIWPLREPRAQRGEAIVSLDAWELLAVDRPATAPHHVALESWPGHGVSVALAWRQGGRVILSASDHESLADAVAAARATGFKGALILGADLAEHPDARGIRHRVERGRTSSAAADLDRLLADDAIRHDGTTHLTAQVVNMRAMPSPDGLRVVSTARADAAKAALWAAARARRPRAVASILTAAS